MSRFPLHRILGISFIVLALPALAIACMWDYDTIRMERSRFPTVLELITGKFLRHSPEYYRWRIADREKRLKESPNDLAIMDDLAVAYDKLGESQKAVDLARKQLELKPDRYETRSNLATFLFHVGKLEESLAMVDSALAINPNAHFGREKYQKSLTEYVLKRREDGQSSLPLANVFIDEKVKPDQDPALYQVNVEASFDSHLAKSGSTLRSTLEERAHAVKGIAGMLRFARHDSPILLEALGSVLSSNVNYPKDDAKLLAARCYIAASEAVSDPNSRRNYRALASSALNEQVRPGTHEQLTLAEVESAFKKEQAEGKAWYAELLAKERGWIESRANPDEEFAKLYAADPELSGMDEKDPMPYEKKLTIGLLTIAVTIGIGLIALLSFIVCFFWRKTRPSAI